MILIVKFLIHTVADNRDTCTTVFGHVLTALLEMDDGGSITFGSNFSNLHTEMMLVAIFPISILVQIWLMP